MIRTEPHLDLWAWMLGTIVFLLMTLMIASTAAS